jgi:hypothetical protein
MIGLIVGIPENFQPGAGIDIDHMTLKDVEDVMIQVYCPNEEEQGMSRDEALALAQERSLEAARQIVDDFFANSTQLRIPEGIPQEEIPVNAYP